ncbi:MAG TPA: C39 family peptidase, partial [Chloroflexota bacterium]|nr:C39 family peptidase [Chloroflexota bacterium]
MQYWGSNRSIGEVIQGVKDRATGIFGNWPLNTAYAGANGFRARVDRFDSIEQVEQEIAAGRPVIISIAFQPGELDGSPIRSTDGHLIVVRGFTEAGDVIVNDPIAPNSGSVRLVYKRGQLEKIWLRSGGIAYLLAPDDGVRAE